MTYLERFCLIIGLFLVSGIAAGYAFDDAPQPPKLKPVVFLFVGERLGTKSSNNHYLRDVAKHLEGTQLDGARLVLLPGIESAYVHCE